ncbi:MAG: tetratricopeptide repeat protein [Elusimicrobia bacterium]|nr:tetratricopeptide repeat protein [Elusimicrobiota bacterium]
MRPPTPPSCTSNGSCSAALPACGQTTTGVDNCGKPCSKTGGECTGPGQNPVDPPTPKNPAGPSGSPSSAVSSPGGGAAGGGGAALSAAGGGNAGSSSVVKPVAPVQGRILREIGDASPQSDMSGVKQAAAMLAGAYPAGTAPQLSNQGSVPYLRASAADFAAAGVVGHSPGADRLTEARARINMSDFDGAKHILDTKITLDPGDYRAVARRAEVLNLLKDFKAAEADARKALALDPENALAWQQLAWSLLKQGRYQEALTAIERAVRSNPDDGTNFAIRSFIKYMLGDAAGAMKDMAAAAALSPEYRAKLAAAKNGAKLYDPDENNDSIFRQVASGLRGLPGWSFFALLAALLLSAAGGAAYSRRAKGARAPLEPASPSGGPSARIARDKLQGQS